MSGFDFATGLVITGFTLQRFQAFFEVLKVVAQRTPLPKRQETANLRHKNCIALSIENTVVQFSIEYPHPGQQKVALKVKAEHGMEISPGGVRSIWLRQNMNTTTLRIARAKSLHQMT